MTKLKVPSLQHLARIWRSDAKSISKVLVGLATHSPTFSYVPLQQIVAGMLLFGTSYEQAIESVRRIKRTDVRENFLGVMPHVGSHFEGVKTSFVSQVAPRLYSVDRQIQVPFSPPFVYGSKGVLHFPWLSFWKINPLEGEALSLFVTIVEEVLLRDSDLEEAKFEILDFSASGPGLPRNLSVIQASEIPRLTHARKVEMLQVFSEGFRMARSELQETFARTEETQVADSDVNQHPLF